ncbi:MAG: type VI secretion system lipoprotein TssJ [Myxococcales bacterium]|nr:type VI secretion system lipoprotein TssJ [Myxococcales bacterium]
MRSTNPWTALAAVLVAAFTLLAAGCKKPEKSCEPSSVDWRLQLAMQASKTINPTDSGDSLPTVVRVFQLRGELAIDSLEFEKVWEAEEPSALGENFLSMEEVTMFPDQNEVREVPVEDEATHVVAAGLFRNPASTSWFTSYEIPKQHPEVVCAKAPTDKVYPNPCFYMLLDRNMLDGGATPPAGYQKGKDLQCAPLGVSIAPELDDRQKRKKERQERRKRRQERRKQIEQKPDDLERQLDGQTPDPKEASDIPGADKQRLPDVDLPDAKLPDDEVPTIDVPDVEVPKK